MMISTTRGEINSRFVRFVKQRKISGRDGKERWTTFVVDDKGEEHETYSSLDELNAAPSIPAFPPLLDLLVVVVDDDKAIGHRYPIIGWRVPIDAPPEPIAIGVNGSDDYTGSNWMSFIVLPNDAGFQEVGFEGARYDTVQETHDAVREHQRESEKLKAIARESAK